MNTFLIILKELLANHPPSYIDSDSIREILYEFYNERHHYDNEHINASFDALYLSMNDTPLQNTGRIVHPSVPSAGNTRNPALWRA